MRGYAATSTRRPGSLRLVTAARSWLPVFFCLTALGAGLAVAGMLAAGCSFRAHEPGGEDQRGSSGGISTVAGAVLGPLTTPGPVTTSGTLPHTGAGGAGTGNVTDHGDTGDADVASDVDALIVFDGDSLTAGTGPAGTDYPSYTLARLPKGVAMVNVAVPGQEWGDMLADAEVQVDPLFEPSAGNNIVVVWAGHNDLHRTHTARRVWRELREYCLGRRARGWKVVVLTVLPKIPTESGCPFERQRRALNHAIREHWSEVADALADVAHDKRLGDYAGLNGARYKTDRVHLNADGNQIVADVVARTVRPLLTEEH